MKRTIWGFSMAALATAILAACGGPPAQTGTSMPIVPSAVTAPERSASWMLPGAEKSPALIYVGDWKTNDVFVLDYENGKAVGALAGFSEPSGMCVDGKGDVYIANFGAGDAVEYARGGTKVLNTYRSGGEPIGCSVDTKGDVAVTSLSPGKVVVFAGGNPAKSRAYTSPCELQWTLGYDDKSNLVGVGQERNSIVACALRSRSQRMTKLSGCCRGPIKIGIPGGTMWDGKHFGLGGQRAGGGYDTGIWPAVLFGTRLFPNRAEVNLEGGCGFHYVDLVNPFILGTKNTPLNKTQAKLVVGPGKCRGVARMNIWHYPSGILLKSFRITASQPQAAAVSLEP